MTVRRWPLAVAMLFVGLGLAACSSTPANDLEAGDCFEDESALNAATSGEDVDTIDCNEGHQFEVIGKFDVDDADEYPGQDELIQEGIETCTGDIFEDYVGVEYNDSPTIYAENPLVPSQQSWDDADDRTVICIGYELDDSGSIQEVDESFEGAES